jgi:hypothetical protein
MNETGAFQLIANFKSQIKTNRGIKLAFNDKEIRLTRYKGEPIGINANYFCVISWPKGTFSGFKGYQGVMEAGGVVVFDTITTQDEVNLLVATENPKGLEAVFERIFFAGDIEFDPGVLTAWLEGPGHSFGEYPIYDALDEEG